MKTTPAALLCALCFSASAEDITINLSPNRGGWELWSSTNLIDWTPDRILPSGVSNAVLPVAQTGSQFWTARAGCDYPDETSYFWVPTQKILENYTRWDADGVERWYRASSTYDEDAVSQGDYNCVQWYHNEDESGYHIAVGPDGALIEFTTWGSNPYRPGRFYTAPEFADRHDAKTYPASAGIKRDKFDRSARTTTSMCIGGPARSCRSFHYRLWVSAAMMDRTANEYYPVDYFPSDRLRWCGRPPDYPWQGGGWDFHAREHDTVDITPRISGDTAGVWVFFDYFLERLEELP